MTEHTHDVVIVGAGLAGLAAAATARAGGASVVVLEAHQPGGRARTTERDGFLFNQGPHALYLGGAGVAVLRLLGMSPTGGPPPLDRYRVVLDGEDHPLPTSASSLLRTSALGFRAKLQLGRLLAALPRLDAPSLAGTTTAAWLGDRGLRPDAQAVVEALIRLSTYCADLGQLGADLAVSQLQVATAGGVLYLDDGWGQLVSALAAHSDVRTGGKVRSIEGGTGKTSVTTDLGTFVARSVIIATGGPDAARHLLPEAPRWDLGPPVTAACLDLGVRRVPPQGYVLSADEPLYATTQSPPARMAPAGGAVVELVRYGARSAAEDRPALDEFVGRTGLTADDIAESRFLARMVVAGALPPLSGVTDRPGVTATGLPGVHLAGDWVGDRGFLADASLASGEAAARAALRHLERSTTMAG